MQLNLYKVRTSLFREGEGGSPRCSFHRGRCKLSRSCEHSPRQARSISADGMSSARPGRRSPRGVYAADQRESSGACFVEAPNSGDNLWLLCGVVLTFGCFMPNMIAAANMDRILRLSSWHCFALFAALDTFFTAAVECFLRIGDAFGQQRNGPSAAFPALPEMPASLRPTRFCYLRFIRFAVALVVMRPWVRTPFKKQGPYTTSEAVRQPPQFFRAYVLVFPFATGILLPLGVTVIAALRAQEVAALTAIVTVPYLYTVYAQIKQESMHIRKGSAMWPQVPVAHMLYRYLQLARGSVMIAGLGGPLWLHWLTAYLACLWTFNFGCVMSWMPSMYYWHRHVAGA